MGVNSGPSVKVRHRLGLMDTSTALQTLDRLEIGDTPPARAALAYARWRLQPDDDDARARASDAYLLALERTPNAEVRLRLLELTGEHYPDPDPLPNVGQGDFTATDLAATLRRGQDLLHEWIAA
jgi:hypothetical protein